MRSRWGVGSCGIVHLVLTAGMIATSGAKARADDDARVLAATIDRWIAARWDETRVTPALPSSDGEFLRRVSLDLTGKIPTVADVREFLDDPRADKRERLIDRLLDGPAYITHITDVDFRLLIPEADSNTQAQSFAPAFESWLREQVAANAGTDEIVRAILTVPIAEDGPRSQPGRDDARSPGPSPLPFYVAKDVKSENIAASTARLFLGLRLECAQCHNHPFASWTRDQFWGYAAFFSSLEKRGPDEISADPIRERPDHREAAIPGTAKVVRATFLDGSTPRFRPHEPARMTLAEWMTAPENPYFARAAVNRIWAQLFGVGLVDPVDDMGADNPPSHPELLDALARAFAEHGFDRKFLIRAIVLSRPYQLSSIPADPGAVASVDPGAGAEAPRLFARMRVRGLTAEQLYDSLSLAVGLSPEPTGDAPTSSRAEFLERFARHDETPTEMQMTILQALTLMNGGLVAGATHLERGATLTAIAEAPFLDTAGRVEALFLATVSRRPKAEEAARMTAYVEGGGASGDRRKALSDVFWALLNSPEFVLNH
jgi:hypothetical protein